MTPAFSLLVLTILAMFSQRYSQAFPLDTINRGAELVATLRLIYLHANTLCEKDFDWLFDCPQTRQFLEWFCSMVSEENVLSLAEVEAYGLLAAGKPILEGDALEQELQMCCPVPQLSSVIPDDEGPSLEAVQQELQELKDYRDCQLWQHTKLRVWAANLQQELYLEEEEKAVKQDMRKSQKDLEAEIFQTNAVLSQISKAAKQLAEWHRDMGKGWLPALLCETDFSSYLELEQQATDVFEKFIQQVLLGSVQAPDAQGASAQGESSLKERLEAGTQMDSDWEIPKGRRGAPHHECAKTLWRVAPASQGILPGLRAELLAEGRNGREGLSLEDEEERDGSREATERMDTKQTTMPKSLGTNGDELLGDQDSYRKEVSQMEKARICAQREVIVTSAKVEGNYAALEWAQRALEALEENQHVVEAELQRQAAVLQKQLHTLRCDITQTLTYQLPPLLKAEVCLSCLPILQRQLSLEDAHLQYGATRQEEAAAWLDQHSRLDLLELQLKRERKELDWKAAQLGEMETAMREAQTRLKKQQDYFKDASSSQKGCPCSWIDPKDLSAVRLCNILLGQDQEEQLFCSYKAIATQCSQMVQDQRVLEAQLAAPMSQLPALESSTEVLYWWLYNSSNLCHLPWMQGGELTAWQPTEGEEEEILSFCTLGSAPQITEPMQQLIIMQDNLYQMLTDLLSDLKVKHRSLESPILQTECNLYVYFYYDEDRLREVVEELEKQVSAFSKGPLMELPYAKE
ncbi:LOW QUALITY PROTEIN: HAUS augmin-like complex subunit 3 [Morus bassanus]